MPVKPENLKLYPGGSLASPQWAAVRADSLARSTDEKGVERCAWCRAPNGKLVLRSECGDSYAVAAGGPDDDWGYGLVDVYSATDGALLRRSEPWDWGAHVEKPVKIVLTVAHLDQDPANNAADNRPALCQRCHNRHDAPHRARNAAITRDRKRRARLAVGDLLEGLANAG